MEIPRDRCHRSGPRGAPCADTMNEPSTEPIGDPVDLSQHLRWMRSLARALVRDEAAADDVVQDAAVAALRQSQRPANVRAWLTAILRNRARDAGRRSSAARRREAECARPEGDGETRELEERAAICGELSQRVLALDEPIKSTLLMRYWDDLPPRVIARRTGVPVATVKSRLARGLARLRVDLDASRGGDRSAWLVAVLPLARPTPLVAASTAAGWTLMNTKVTLAAAAALGGALLLLPEGSAPSTVAEASTEVSRIPGSDHSGGGSSGGGGGGSAGTVPRSRTGAEAGARAAQDASAPEVFTLSARVVDGEGRPVSGVRVGIERSEVAAETNATGTVALETVLSSGSVVAMEPGRWVTVRAGHWRAADPGSPLVVVAPALTLEGLVVDGFGFPVAESLVEIVMPSDFHARFDESMGSSTRADWKQAVREDGTFVFEGAPLMAGARIVATCEGYEQASVEVPAASRADIALTLRRPAAPAATALRGRVLREDGSPATAARVALGTELVAVDEQGTFELDLAMAPGAARLRAVEAGALPARFDRPGEPEDPRGGWPEFVELRLGGAPLTIAGVVEDDAGEPVAGARVWLDDPTEFGTLGAYPVRQEALSAGLPPGDAAIRSLAAMGAPGDGANHGSATPVGAPNASLQWVETDAEGRFELGGLADRAYVLDVVGGRVDCLGRSEPIRAGTADARIIAQRQERFAELRGTVVTRSGQPVPNAAITPWIPALSADIDVRDGRSSVMRFFLGESVTSEDDGTFVLRDVPRRFVQFHIGGPSILPGYSSVDAVDDPGDFRIEVRARVEVTVEVIDPALGIDSVTALDASGRPAEILRMFADGYSTLAEVSVQGGRTGAFALTTDAATLELRSNGVVRATVPVDLVPGEVNRIVH